MENNDSIKIWEDDWVDAQAMAIEHSDTFEAPKSIEIYRLNVNDQVKICNNQERFWVTILNIEKKPSKRAKKWKFIGKVDNDLFFDSPYNYSDFVIFEGCHIYSILSRNDVQEEIAKFWENHPELIGATDEAIEEHLMEMEYPDKNDNS